MADKDDGEETASRGADWEVVSLTASAYAAAPGPKQVESQDDEKVVSVGGDKAETSDAVFMSSHFVFPPSQHENLPLESENTEISDEKRVEDAVSELVEEEGAKADTKDKGNLNVKNLSDSDEIPAINFTDEKFKDFEGSTALQGLNLAEKEESIYGTANFSSFHSSATMGASTTVDESRVLTEPEDYSDSALDSDTPHLPKHVDEDDYDGSGLPGAAWWKKRAASLYAHAKEANTFWSIFVAAAVMGIVIIGQQWQQERWQVLHYKWQFGINDEKMSRMLGPLSRFKDVIVGGNRRGSFIRGSASPER